jgi:hypothetical protein
LPPAGGNLFVAMIGKANFGESAGFTKYAVEKSRIQRSGVVGGWRDQAPVA